MVFGNMSLGTSSYPRIQRFDLVSCQRWTHASEVHKSESNSVNNTISITEDEHEAGCSEGNNPKSSFVARRLFFGAV
jgi:hypothetical protein